MIALRWKVGALGAFLLTVAATAQIGPGPFAAFPTANATDARFMGFGCAGIATFEQGVSMALAIPAGQPNFTVSIFDGDTGGVDSLNRQHWDVGTRQLIYSLYADPLRTGTPVPANLIGTWTGNAANPTSGPLWTATAANMPDNDWWGVTVSTSPGAQGASGNYFYLLTIALDGVCAPLEVTEANIKIAATNPMSFQVPRFGLVAALRQFANDGPIVYPGTFPPPGNDFVHAPSTYNGTFDFFFKLHGGETDLRLYDGDFDFGTSSLVGLPSGTVLNPCVDTDDPDTSPLYAGFPFSTVGANPEGINSPGSPADDSNFDVFRRGDLTSSGQEVPGRIGCVRYEVTDPNGTTYRNDNPSGSLEWEQFRIATPLAVNPSDSDYVASTNMLPSGAWHLRVIGLDLSNLNFFFANACATRNQGPACVDLSVYLLGDTVWLDKNGNGVQDSGEPGIAGVKVNLLNSDLSVVDTVVTGDTGQPNWAACTVHNTGLGTQGLYCHGVNAPGDYLLQIAPENFQPGGALQGLASTTGGQSQTHTVTNDNVSIYDFGYRGTGSIGDRVWQDTDADGAQDGGEPGINGVTVELLDSGGNVVATQVTSGDGNYNFTNLAPGTYSVRIVSSTLPAGLAPSFDFDGTGTPNIAMVSLAPGALRADVDFGYRGTASVGNRVWNDVDGDGVQDGGEAGLNGVTVELLDGDGDVVATQTTSGDGNYSFTNLTAGTYSVRVVSSTLPAGFVPTYDLDGTGTPHIATFTLGAGQNRTDVNFGYRNPPTLSVGDRVWNDADGDGVQDSGEAGLNSITVQLLNSLNVVIATQTTSGDGNYLFTNLASGTYTVRIVSATLPAGFVPTYDLDGTGTPHQATFSLSASRNDVDFGYRSSVQQPGTGTLGYWKNHPEAWPVQTITVGGKTYTKAQAISIMGTPGRGDKTYDMFKQLVAAKLNVLIGNASSCISSTIAAADAWLTTYPVGSGISGSSSAWATGGPLHIKLDDYNNGRLCAPHRN